MTRKLPFLFVVMTAVCAVSLLQAQDCQCPASKTISKSASSCQSCSKTDCATTTAATKLISTSDVAAIKAALQEHTSCQKQKRICSDCETNCASCSQDQCEVCPSCISDTTSVAPRSSSLVSQSTCASSNCITNPTLPGSTSFIQEQSAEAAAERQQLAAELTNYLTSGQHDPQHIQQVLSMALDSTADSAHRIAMTSSSLNTGNPLPPLTLPASNSQPAPPVIGEVVDRSMDMRQLRRQQETMQQMMEVFQKDMQRVAEDLSQLQVELRMSNSRSANFSNNQPRPFAQSQNQYTNHSPRATNQRWQSIQNPHAIDRYSSSASNQNSTEMLNRQIAMLKQELRQVRMQNSNVAHAGFQQPVQLQPLDRVTTPLAPATTPTITKSYYVGDLMAPPFAGATLKLMQYLKANVAPESWTDSKMMEITEPSISLLITQSPENHQRIAEILRQVRVGVRSYQSGGQRR